MRTWARWKQSLKTKLKFKQKAHAKENKINKIKQSDENTNSRIPENSNLHSHRRANSSSNVLFQLYKKPVLHDQSVPELHVVASVKFHQISTRVI
jgi:hypothetical protein